MNFFNFFIVLLISCSFIFSCKKKCINKIEGFSSFPIEVLNREDTIAINDSIVYYLALEENKFDLESGESYNLKDLGMVLIPYASAISDSVHLNSIISSGFSDYFDIKVEIGDFVINQTGIYNTNLNGIEPKKIEDSLYYKFVLHPKQTGLFGLFIQIKIPDEKYYDTDFIQGIVLKEEDECLMLMELSNVLITKPQDVVNINYNNFDMYYNSGLFHPGEENINDIEILRQKNNYYYFVYVE